ncbi:hypothetical protein EJB05_47786, partial [Eragrostis curvula]
MEALPVLTYATARSLKADRGALECAVCLAEFGDDGEKPRLLTGCCHVFHAACIDVWLAAHVTCPVCRADLCTPGAVAIPNSDHPHLPARKGRGASGRPPPVAARTPPPLHAVPRQGAATFWTRLPASGVDVRGKPKPYVLLLAGVRGRAAPGLQLQFTDSKASKHGLRQPIALPEMDTHFSTGVSAIAPVANESTMTADGGEGFEFDGMVLAVTENNEVAEVLDGSEVRVLGSESFFDAFHLNNSSL